MQVFITGATGDMGFAVAGALRRADYRVFGLARTQGEASRFERHEIQPVIGDLADPNSYAAVATECGVLIHTAFDYAANGVAKDKTTLETLLEAVLFDDTPTTEIYTSGA